MATLLWWKGGPLQQITTTARTHLKSRTQTKQDLAAQPVLSLNQATRQSSPQSWGQTGGEPHVGREWIPFVLPPTTKLKNGFSLLCFSMCKCWVLDVWVTMIVFKCWINPCSFKKHSITWAHILAVGGKENVWSVTEERFTHNLRGKLNWAHADLNVQVKIMNVDAIEPANDQNY